MKENTGRFLDSADIEALEALRDESNEESE
jgi:hypothetical protein